PVIGGLSALVGLHVSWSWDLPTGGAIVLVLTAVFLAAWLFSPSQGVLARLVANRRAHATDPAPAPPAATRPALHGAAPEDGRPEAAT
ncbi:MAG: metal ABC transporter permease, partial [Propionibacteriaceae bacterium]|nr:metal ABC transporter permease [Propionibacteriaceae bacterium]